MGGGQRKNLRIKFPRQPKPTTQQQWGTWKAYMHRSFLCEGTRLAHPISPIQKNQSKIPSDIETVIEMKSTQDSTMETLYEMMYQHMKTICGNINLLQDNGEQLKQALLDGYLVVAPCDGSLSQYEGDGTHAYISCEEGSWDNIIEGHTDTPSSDEISSQTTEHYGLI